MKKVLIGALAVLMLFAMCNIAMAACDAAVKLENDDESKTPDSRYWFPHYLLAPGDVKWTDYDYGNDFWIDYPPNGLPKWNVDSGMTIITNGIVRYGSTTWKGDICLAVETTMTTKYDFRWWPFVNIPGQGGIGVPYVVKWVGDPWDKEGYWKRLYQLDP